jgi:hypothetical protein
VREEKEFIPMEALEFLRKQAAKGGKAAAARMTPKARRERARKAAAASAKVRSKNARAKRAKVKAG